jgi:hypothetical protein
MRRSTDPELTPSARHWPPFRSSSGSCSGAGGELSVRRAQLHWGGLTGAVTAGQGSRGKALRYVTGTAESG